MTFSNIEDKVNNFIINYSDWFLRIAIAIIYIWFGILKPFDSSPAADLVANSVYFLPREAFFIFLGIFEVLIGILFLIPRFTKLAFWLMMAHMAGTFIPFITLPEAAFVKFPFSLTIEGQYIIKNFALVASATAVLKNYLRK